MRLPRYSDLDTSGLQRPHEQTIALLAAGDFRGADVKKLTGRPFYRAKLSASDRLLFRFGGYGGETVLILLEIIRNHAYDRSPTSAPSRTRTPSLRTRTSLPRGGAANPRGVVS